MARYRWRPDRRPAVMRRADHMQWSLVMKRMAHCLLIAVLIAAAGPCGHAVSGSTGRQSAGPTGLVGNRPGHHRRQSSFPPARRFRIHGRGSRSGGHAAHQGRRPQPRGHARDDRRQGACRPIRNSCRRRADRVDLRHRRRAGGKSIVLSSQRPSGIRFEMPLSAIAAIEAPKPWRPMPPTHPRPPSSSRSRSRSFSSSCVSSTGSPPRAMRNTSPPWRPNRHASCAPIRSGGCCMPSSGGSGSSPS